MDRFGWNAGDFEVFESEEYYRAALLAEEIARAGAELPEAGVGPDDPEAALGPLDDAGDNDPR